MLPVSVDYPAVQLAQYPQNNPPFVPAIAVSHEASAIVVLVAALIANEAANYASRGPHRMFCYNLLCDANWQNTNYAELIRTTCEYAVLKWRQGQAQSPASAASECVTEMLSMFTSSLVVNFNELASLLPPDVVNASLNNSQVYNDVLNQIDMMSGQLAQQPYQPQRSIPMQNQRGGPQVRHHQPQRGVVQVPRGSATVRPYQGTSAVQAENVQTSRFASVKKPVEKQPQQEVTLPKADENIVFEGIDTVNRQHHCIIYGGVEYPASTSKTRRRIEEQIEVLEEADPDSLKTAIPELNSEWYLETTLDGIFTSIRATNLHSDVGNLVVNYGFVVTPVFSALDITKSLFNELSRCASFGFAVQALNSFLERNKKETKDKLRASLAIVNQIDRYMTKLVRRYLENEIGEDINIDSFIEDVPGLAKYLNENFNGAYNKSYDDFQKKVLSVVFKHTRAAGSSEDPVATFFDLENANVYWDNLVSSCCVIYINASSLELGYNIDSSGKQIKQDKTPLLFRLINAALNVSEHTGATIETVVLTADNVCYDIFTQLTVSGENVIRVRERV